MTRFLLLAVLACLLAAAPASAVTKQELRVPMRDGVELAVDLYLPDGAAPGAPVPVILTMTPYHALYKGLGDGRVLEQWRFLDQGYAVAMADVRGTYESGGCWDYGGQREIEDGYDLVEWLGTQPWSNGRVGMIGASYDGTTANAAAIAQPPHLATIVPISAISRWWGYAYTQGARHSYSGESADIDPPSDTPADFQFGYGFLPPPEPGAVTAAQQVAMRWTPCDRVDQLLHGYDTEPDFDDFWVARDYLRHADRVQVPTLVAHGFQDYNVKTWEGTQWFQALRAPKFMIVGQWGHAIPPWPDWNDFLDRWFASWLKGEPNGVAQEGPVVTQSTDGEFRRTSAWPGAGEGVPSSLGDGEAEYRDDGTLTESEMLRTGCAGGRCVRVEFLSTGGMHLRGRPTLTLTASSDQPSTHFVAVLVERTATGSRKVISRAFMNARYRGSLERGEDLVPGERYPFVLEFIDKDHILAEDSTLELFVASSSTTWVLPDERRAVNRLYLGDSRLNLILARPEQMPAPPATQVTPPAAEPRPARCRRRATLRLPRSARGRLKVTVNGRRAKARRRGRKLTVTLPHTRSGRATVRVKKGRKTVMKRRVKTCRR